MRKYSTYKNMLKINNQKREEHVKVGEKIMLLKSCVMKCCIIVNPDHISCNIPANIYLLKSTTEIVKKGVKYVRS